jgi:hypothetical protein
MQFLTDRARPAGSGHLLVLGTNFYRRAGSEIEIKAKMDIASLMHMHRVSLSYLHLKSKQVFVCRESLVDAAAAAAAAEERRHAFARS